MQKHCQGAMLPPYNYNPTTRMWQLFIFSTILNQRILEWIMYGDGKKTVHTSGQ